MTDPGSPGSSTDAACPDVLTPGQQCVNNDALLLQASPSTVLSTRPLAPPEPPNPTVYTGRDAAQWWGVPGEQDMGFLLGLAGYDPVIGPSGTSGKSAFANGLEGLFITRNSPNGLPLLIPDNKSSGLPENIGECKAFTDDFGTKLSALIDQARSVDMPHKDTVIAKLEELRKTVSNGGGHVADVEFKITGAGGYATGVTNGLQEKFFKANGLTDANGDPLQVGFMASMSQKALDAYKTFVKAARSTVNPTGNPRGPGGNPEVLVTEPVVVDPARAVLEHQEALNASMQEAWLGALLVIKAAIALIFHFIPTTAERQLKEITPKILAGLRENPGAGVLLICRYWLPEENFANYTDTAAPPTPPTPQFRDWRWQYGPTADDAYAWWLGPGRAYWVDEPGMQAYNVYFWFDGRSTKSYDPPRLSQ